MPKPKQNRLKKIKLPSSSQSRIRLSMFVALFALIGAYLIFASFAAYISSSAEGVQYNDTNATRSQHGVPGVAYNTCLSGYARQWAQQMAAQNTLSHDPNMQGQLGNCAGSSWRNGGENVGTGGCGNMTDQDCSQYIYNAFINSSEHYANIVSTNYSTVGIGSYRDNNNTMWIAVKFMGCTSTCPGNGTPPSAGGSGVSNTPPPAPKYKALSIIPCNGGFTLDAAGGLHSFNGFSSNMDPRWPGQDAARMVAVDPNCSGQGYILDLYGGIHNFNGAPAVNGTGYWYGQDVARDLKFYDWSGHQGYVLDCKGALHPVNGAPNPNVTGYWPNQCGAAKKFAINGASTGGYVVDLYGGIHPFSIGSNPIPAGVTGTGYWPGKDTARGIILDPNGYDGYILDYCGALHPFAAQGYPLPPAVSVSFYNCGDDWAQDLVATVWNKDNSGQPGGYVLTKDGGVHIFGPGATVQATTTTNSPASSIVGVGSKRCIDIPYSDTTNGNQLIIWDCTGNSNQKWIFNSDGSIHSALNTNKCIDLNGSNTNGGTKIQIYDCNGSKAQKWVYGSDKLIRSAINHNDVLDVTGGSTEDGAKIEIWGYNGGYPNQLWSRT